MKTSLRRATALFSAFVLYYRKAKSPPYQTVKALAQVYAGATASGEYAYSKLTHSLNYLKRVRTDGTPEGHFQRILLALLGGQFYLLGTSRDAGDTRLLCDRSDVDRVAEDLAAANLLLPAEVDSRARRIDFRPGVQIDGDTITVRMVSFGKRTGFVEDVYVLDRKRLDDPVAVQHHVLVAYNP